MRVDGWNKRAALLRCARAEMRMRDARCCGFGEDALVMLPLRFFVNVCFVKLSFLRLVRSLLGERASRRHSFGGERIGSAAIQLRRARSSSTRWRPVPHPFESAARRIIDADSISLLHVDRDVAARQHTPQCRQQYRKDEKTKHVTQRCSGATVAAAIALTTEMHRGREQGR